MGNSSNKKITLYYTYDNSYCEYYILDENELKEMFGDDQT